MDQRRWCSRIGMLMFGLALVCAVAQVLGARVDIPASTLFLIFGCWMFSVMPLLEQLAAHQARDDMRRIAKQGPVEP